MQYEYTPNEDGTFRITDVDGNVYADSIESGQISAFETYQSKGLSPLSETGRKSGVAARNEANLNKVLHTQQLDEKLENPEYAEKYQEYKTGVDLPGGAIPSWTRTGLHMIDSSLDIWDGIQDSIDAMDYMFTKDPQLIQDKIDRDIIRDERTSSTEYDVLQETSGPASEFIGKSMPLMLAGQGEIPLAKMLLGGARTITKPTAEFLSEMKTIPGTASDTISDIATGKINRFAPEDPYNVNAGEQLLGTTVTGGYEGVIADDERGALMGAAENLFGTGVGRSVAAPFRRTENLRNPQETEIMKQAKILGKDYLPGVKFGDLEKQITESTMRGNTRMVNTIKTFDDANAKVDNTVVSNALGMPNEMGDSLLPNIGARRNIIKNDFDNLSKQTNGKFSKSGLRRLNAKKAEYIQNANVTSDEAVKYLNPYLEMFNRWSKKVNPRTGRNTDFDGMTYQRERSKLDRAIKSKAATDNPEVMETLRMVRDELDAAVRNGTVSSKMGPGGVVDQSGNDLLSQWEKARENYALVDMVFDKGIKSDGTLDMSSLHKHFMETDKTRYLSGDKNNRLSEVYAISRAEDLKGNMQGSGLGGKDIEGFDSGRSVNLGQRAMNRRNTLTQRAILQYYKSGVPDFGMTPEGSGVLGRMGAASIQSTAPHQKALEELNQGVDKLNSISEMAIQWFHEDEEPTQDPNGATQ